jgi:putative phosphoesterase
MRIAIISDTHSRHGAVEKAVRLIDEARVELTIHCGDITDSETIWLFPPNTHFVWGNCDADRASLRQAIHGIGATCHEYDGRLELAGKRLGFTHGDDAELLDELILSGELDFVLHSVHAGHQPRRLRARPDAHLCGARHRFWCSGVRRCRIVGRCRSGQLWRPCRIIRRPPLHSSRLSPGQLK